MVDELPDTGEVDPGEAAEDEFDESYDPDSDAPAADDDAAALRGR